MGLPPGRLLFLSSHSHPGGESCKWVPGGAGGQKLSLTVPWQVTTARPRQAPGPPFLSSHRHWLLMRVLLVGPVVLSPGKAGQTSHLVLPWLWDPSPHPSPVTLLPRQALSLPSPSSRDILQSKLFVLHGKLTTPLLEVIPAPASRRKTPLIHGSPHWELH